MRCQWIEGDPVLADDLDAIKCNRPTVDRSCPWCPEHLARVFRKDGVTDEAFSVEPEPLLVEDEPEPVEPEEDAA